jgi:hypothetical protein
MKLVNTPFSNNCLETKSHSILSLKLNRMSMQLHPASVLCFAKAVMKLEEARADLLWKHDSRPAVVEHSSGHAGNDVLIDSARKSAELKPFVCTAKTGALRAARCEKHDASCGLPAVRLYFSKRRTFVVEA